MMPLSFPNHSRVYDPTRRAVHFWGHDSAMEFSFFVSEDALLRIASAAALDDAGLLDTFDANRDRVHAAATRVYERGRKGSYNLAWRDL